MSETSRIIEKMHASLQALDNPGLMAPRKRLKLRLCMMPERYHNIPPNISEIRASPSSQQRLDVKTLCNRSGRRL
ncbi:MAG: hypothetical protein K5657_10240 [Desulfovibrio sp.]|nr:hypothetical protein [Desulfovibrio sp.]